MPDQGCPDDHIIGAPMVYLVICDDGNSQVAEIDVDSVWATETQAHERKQQITNARRVWVEGRTIGEIGVVYH